MSKIEAFDAIVVGGGCGGLWTADTLSGVGMRVLLVEREQRLGAGPSGRNGGFVHGGGFHAAVIADESEALAVAGRCQIGRGLIESQCPEAILREGAPVHLFARSSQMAALAEARWTKAGLNVSIRSRAEVEQMYPGLALETVRLAAKVNDFPIDYRILYQVLLMRIRRAGGLIRLGTEFRPLQPGYGRLLTDITVSEVHAPHIIYCTGAGTPAFLEKYHKNMKGTLHTSLWKSHVIVSPKIFDTGFLFLDPGEVSIMPQRNYALVCQSQEDTLVDEANYDVIPQRVEGLLKKLEEVVPRAARLRHQMREHSCLKPSASYGLEKRSVSTLVTQLSSHELLALPGKATEAPLMAHEVLQKMLASPVFHEIAPRPGDLASEALAMPCLDHVP